MTFRRAVAAFALAAYPSDFRKDYGEAILSDLELDSSGFLTTIFDIIETGLSMRIDTFWRDLSYAARRLRSAPLFVAIVVGAFALGIGANVAMFSILNDIVLKPLPYPNANRLIAFKMVDQRRASAPSFSVLDVHDILERTHAIEAAAGIAEDSGTMLVNGVPHTLAGLDVTSRFFAILGGAPEIGRYLDASDGRPGMRNIVIGDSLWRKYFHGTPDALGASMTIDGNSYQIVGVMPPGTLLPDGRLLEPYDYVVSLPENVPARERASRDLGAIGLLKSGVSLAAASEDMRSVSAELRRAYPAPDAAFDVRVQPLSAQIVGAVAPQLWTIFVAVVGILLIACANVANMIAARWSVRDREFALRRALGASGGRLVSQLLTETALLAVIGGIVGLFLAYGALHWLSGPVLSTLPRSSGIAIDGRALWYAVLVVVVTTLLAGMSPMAALAKSDLQLVLKSAGRGGDASASGRIRSALVVIEVALALALIIVSSLVVRSFTELTNTPLGIRPAGISESSFYPLPSQRYPTLESRALAQRALLERLHALPGIDSAALAVTYPLGDVSLHFDIGIAGRKYALGHEPEAAANDVSPGYFRTLGIPLLRGRDFTGDDTASSPPVAVVNEAFVRAYLHGSNPIGVRLHLPGWNGTKPVDAAIVGVVGNERFRIDAPMEPKFYAPIAQSPPQFISAVVHRTTLDPAGAAREMQSVFTAVNPISEPPEITTVDDRIARETATARAAATILATLAGIAMILALSGIYGVVSFAVSQRSREFGVRLALGAGTRDLLADVLRRSLITTAIGLVCGLAIATAAASAIAPQLSSVSPFDPATFVAVLALLLACAAVAALVPALRATRVDPAVALRYE